MIIFVYFVKKYFREEMISYKWPIHIKSWRVLWGLVIAWWLQLSGRALVAQSRDLGSIPSEQPMAAGISLLLCLNLSS